jgi:hypothetical protein
VRHASGGGSTAAFRRCGATRAPPLRADLLSDGLLVRWFAWWEIPLESMGQPTPLNLAISQTNLFYDQSKRFLARTSAELAHAFGRLSRIVEDLELSGVLLAGLTAADAAREHLGVGSWDASRSGRFTLLQGAAGQLLVVVCPHPRTPVAKTDVQAHTRRMQQWTDTVMLSYYAKQAGPRA